MPGFASELLPVAMADGVGVGKLSSSIALPAIYTRGPGKPLILFDANINLEENLSDAEHIPADALKQEGEADLTGKDKTDSSWQISADALHDLVWYSGSTTMMAPVLQIFLCR